MHHVSSAAKNVNELIEEVETKFCPHSQGSGDVLPVLQVVAVPLFASFPDHDLFILQRRSVQFPWFVAAGHQCKQGKQCPDGVANGTAGMSVWIEGKCPMHHMSEEGKGKKKHAQVAMRDGWSMLGLEMSSEFLGVSMTEALP